MHKTKRLNDQMTKRLNRWESGHAYAGRKVLLHLFESLSLFAFSSLNLIFP